jgi:hypothetical protein
MAQRKSAKIAKKILVPEFAESDILTVPSVCGKNWLCHAQRTPFFLLRSSHGQRLLAALTIPS